jgi:HEAT repeat protein
VTECLKPSQMIQQMVIQRLVWPNEYILAELTAMPVLPDAGDVLWNDEKTWEQAYLFVALADVAAYKRLRPAIPLLFERACYGDPGEMMRGLRHSLEAIVEENWQLLGLECQRAAKSPQKGARLWAIAELGVLREKRSLQTVIEALDDEAGLVRVRACSSLGAICYANPECRPKVEELLRRYLEIYPSSSHEFRAASDTLKTIEDDERSE